MTATDLTLSRGRHTAAGIVFTLTREQEALDPRGRDVVFRYELKTSDHPPVELGAASLLDFESVRVRFLEDAGVLLPAQLRGQWSSVVAHLFDNLRPVREDA